MSRSLRRLLQVLPGLLLLLVGIQLARCSRSPTPKTNTAVHHRLAPGSEQTLPQEIPLGAGGGGTTRSRVDDALPDVVVLRVEDRFGRPISAVHVALRAALSTDVLVDETGESGEIRVDRLRLRDSVEVTAEHPDYVPFRRVLVPPVDDTTRITLVPWGRIAGLVVDSNGAPVGTKPLVLAHLVSQPPGKQQVLDAIRAHRKGVPVKELVVTEANEHGEFSLERLVTGSSYSLLCGGGGVALLQPMVVSPDSEPLVVQVEALFGARLSVEGVPPGAAVLWEIPEPAWFWDPDGTRASGFETDSLTAILVGLEVQETVRAPALPLPLLFFGPPELEAVGPIRFQGTPAGYSPIATNLTLPRITGTIPSATLDSAPVVPAWGKISVRFLGVQQNEDVERLGRLGRILLSSAETGSVLEKPFTTWSPGAAEVGGVPFGRYAASISTEAGYTNYPSVERWIDVDSSSDTETVSFDLIQECQVEVAAVRRSGELVEGELLIEVAQSAQDDWFSSFVGFRRSPYVVQGLVPGQYQFAIYKPFHDAEMISLEVIRQVEPQSIVFQER